MATQSSLLSEPPDPQHYQDGLHPVEIPDGLHLDSTAKSHLSSSSVPSYYASFEPKEHDHVKDVNYIYSSELPSDRPRRICGLVPRTFWILLAVIAIITIAAAVGGGVGGSVSKKNNQPTSSALGDSGSPTTVTVIASSSTFSTTTSSTSATTTTSSSPATTTSARPGYCPSLVPNWISQGAIALGIGLDGYGVRFADLNGDGRVEYLYLQTNGSVIAYLNLGSPDPNPLNAGKVGWLAQGTIASGVGGLRDQIRFADLDGDGKADYLWVHDDGSVDAWLNMGGPDDGADAAKVTWLGQGKIADGIGKDGSNTVFADIDGDGLADYLWLDPQTGNVTAYLNMGPLVPGKKSVAGQVGWYPLGIIASGFTIGSASGGSQALAAANFADMNGDGRMDYCVLSYVNGNVSAWDNKPGTGDGKGNITWTPTGIIAAGVGDDGRTVQFGDLNGDGRWDYLDVDSTSGAVNAWLNGC